MWIQFKSFSSCSSKVKCFNKKLERKVYQKGNFWVVENFIKAEHGDLDCHETITYTTNGEYPYLDNLGPVVRKWLAPISLALYCGGEDFQNCVDTLAYIRTCRKNVSHARLLRKYLSVHLFFENTQVPPNVRTLHPSKSLFYKHPFTLSVVHCQWRVQSELLGESHGKEDTSIKKRSLLLH